MLYLDHDLTMDAWVNIVAQGGAWKHTIVDKRQFFGSGSAWQGYWFYVDQLTPTTGRLMLEFNDASSPVPAPVVGPTFTFAGFQHLTFSTQRDCSGTVGRICTSFWVNGVLTPGANRNGETGAMGTTNGLRIGDDIVASTNNNWILGCIDELEIFCTALSTQQILAIYNAGVHGKCKEACVAPRNRAMYFGDTWVRVPYEVCNYTATNQCYTITAHPSTCTPSSGILTPTGITVSPTGPICVAPGARSVVWITIPRPAFVHRGDIACYTVCMTNTVTGESTCCQGSVRNAGDRFWIDWPPMARGTLVAIDADFGPIVVNPIGPIGSPAVDMRVFVLGPDGQPDFTTIGLNALPPGKPMEFTLADTALEIPLVVSFYADDPGQVYSIILEADLDGDGEYEPLESFSVTRGASAGPCDPVEDEDFEFHPPGTVCGIEGFIPWQNGNDVCGVVSTEQASSGNRSLKIVGAVGGSGGLGDDTVLPVSDVESGRWTFRCMTFVPNGAVGDGAVILLNTYDDALTPLISWYSAQIRFRAGSNLITADFGAGSTSMVKGQWVELRVEIDLDTDRANYFYNGVQFVTNRHWSDGVQLGRPARHASAPSTSTAASPAPTASPPCTSTTSRSRPSASPATATATTTASTTPPKSSRTPASTATARAASAARATTASSTSASASPTGTSTASRTPPTSASSSTPTSPTSRWAPSTVTSTATATPTPRTLDSSSTCGSPHRQGSSPTPAARSDPHGRV